jgi:hypothetical protein
MLGAARLDHVGIAGPDGRHPLVGLLGSSTLSPTRMPSGVDVARFGADGRLELVWPGSPPTPIDAVLRRRGPGLHHVALRVDEPLDGLHGRLRDAGIAPVGDVQRSSDGRPSLFLHPRDLGGVLVELVEGARA